MPDVKSRIKEAIPRRVPLPVQNLPRQQNQILLPAAEPSLMSKLAGLGKKFLLGSAIGYATNLAISGYTKISSTSSVCNTKEALFNSVSMATYLGFDMKSVLNSSCPIQEYIRQYNDFLPLSSRDKIEGVSQGLDPLTTRVTLLSLKLLDTVAISRVVTDKDTIVLYLLDKPARASLRRFAPDKEWILDSRIAKVTKVALLAAVDIGLLYASEKMKCSIVAETVWRVALDAILRYSIKESYGTLGNWGYLIGRITLPRLETLYTLC